MNHQEIEELELDAVLDFVQKMYGYDFHDYARSSVHRRIKNIALNYQCQYLSQLIPKILYEPRFFSLFLQGMSVTVTEMFREPWVFKTIKEQVFASLKKLPKINIWHAGCSTGEEVYSLAILLKENNLLDYCQIYATDFNESVLETAKKAIYPLDVIQQYTKNYIQAGGNNSFSDYYHVKYGTVSLAESIKNKITFSNHNLVTDGIFGEMNLIVCRNVLIYFKQNLQAKVLKLFDESLSARGFLVLGDKESIRFSPIEAKFKKFAKKEKIYRKI